MDIQLPGMSGIECVSRLKELLPDVQVIMLTVYADPDRIFSAIRAGASGYLLKRSASERLFQAIREVQAGGAPMSGAIARKVFGYFQDQQAPKTEAEKLSTRERGNFGTDHCGSVQQGNCRTPQHVCFDPTLAFETDIQETPRSLARGSGSEISPWRVIIPQKHPICGAGHSSDVG